MNINKHVEIIQERRFTDEQIEQANRVNIIEYAKNRGYPVKRVSAQSYKIPGYGGLYIHSDGHKWNRFSADAGGGTIQFVMHMENRSWGEAIKELLNIPVSQLYNSPVRNEINGNGLEKKPFQLPEKNDTYKHLFAYLIVTRKINKQIVYDLVKSDQIYENKHYNSCVFVGYDNNGEVKYAAIRGTNPSMQYRKDVAGSDKSYPFMVKVRDTDVCNDSSFNSDHLYVFESPIDLMSYLSVLKLYRIRGFDAYFISLGGVYDPALERFLNEHPDVKEITLGLDNDKAGRFACEQIRQKYSGHYSILRHLPQNKDFNDDLQELSITNCQQSLEETKINMFSTCTPDDDEMLLSQ